MSGTTNTMAGLFHKSPVKPIQNHMRLVMTAIGLLPNIFDAALTQQQAQLTVLACQLQELAKECHAVRSQLHLLLPKSLMMPVDRRDLLEIVMLQESMIDVAVQLAGYIQCRYLELGDDFGPGLFLYVQKTVEVCNQALQIIEELDELVTMGFGGRQSTKVVDMINDLNQSTAQILSRQFELMKQLFAQEDRLQAPTILFVSRLIEWINQLAIGADKMGNALRLLLAR